MPLLTNASPRNIALGTDDQSMRIVYPEPIGLPQHTPKVFFFAEKGTTSPVLVDGPKFLKQFGDKTLNSSEKYFNHASLFASKILGEANSIVAQRVVPSDSAISKLNLYVHVKLQQLIAWERDNEGNFVLDGSGNRIDTGNTIDGYFIQTLVDYVTEEPGEVITIGAGEYLYPIFSLDAANPGAYYNNLGIAIKQNIGDNKNSAAIDKGLFTYDLQLFEKTPTGRTSISTLYGDKEVEFSFTEYAKNPITETIFDFSTMLQKSWTNTDDVLLPLAYPLLAKPRVHYASIASLQNLLRDSETTVINNTSDPVLTLSTTDFADADSLSKDSGLINIIGVKYSNSVPYYGSTANIDDAVDPTLNNELPILLSTYFRADVSSGTPLYLREGLDGTISNSIFETLVAEQMQKYNDTESEVIDTATNVESIFYDSGFTLDTKKELCKFVAIRKDLFLVLSSYTHNEENNFPSIADESTTAAILKTQLKLMPESDYFGTPVMRGMIVMGSGMLSDETYRYRVPQSLDVAVKAARYMGRGDGSWSSVYRFDRTPNSVISILKDLKPDFIPAGTKAKLWANGLVWSQPLDRRQFHFPAFQTVYENDTSVLNSFFTAMAICTLNKINDDAWRNFTGSNGLSGEKLAELVEAFVNKSIKGKFDNMFTIIPKVIITEADEQRGYSWNLVTHIYAQNMKTVMVSRIVSARASDLG